MKVSEMKKLLKKAGCRKIREGGNHEIWFSPITLQGTNSKYQDITGKS